MGAADGVMDGEGSIKWKVGKKHLGHDFFGQCKSSVNCTEWIKKKTHLL